jgi:hypothetical protein
MELLGNLFSPLLFFLGFFFVLTSILNVEPNRANRTSTRDQGFSLPGRLVIGIFFLAAGVILDTNDRFRPWYAFLLFSLGAGTLIMNLLSRVGRTGFAWLRRFSLATALLLSGLLMGSGVALSAFDRTNPSNIFAGIFNQSTPTLTGVRLPAAQVSQSTGGTSQSSGVREAPASVGTQADATNAFFCVVNCGAGTSLNIRISPSLDSQVVGSIPCGVDAVQVFGDGVTEDGVRWVRVEYNGVRGWAASNLLAPTCRRGQRG